MPLASGGEFSGVGGGAGGGVQGFQGFQGAQGNAGGAQGAQGAQGVQGAGLQGAQGSQGPTGSQGVQGSSGAQGAQGIAGGGGASPLTTKGDLWGFDTANNRVGVGANGTVLMGDSVQGLGVGYSTRDANFSAHNLVNASGLFLGATSAGHGSVVSDHSSVTVNTDVSSGGAGVFAWDLGQAFYNITHAQGLTNSAIVSISPTWDLQADTFLMSGIVMTPTFTGNTPPSASARFIDITPQLNIIGTWPEVVGCWLDPTVAANVTVTNYKGLVVGDINSGAVTTATGVDIGVTAPLRGTTVWGVVCANVNSYFAGKTTFGSNATPTSMVTCAAGTSSLAPLQLTAGTNLSAVSDGVFEYDGAHLYFSIGSTRHTIV